MKEIIEFKIPSILDILKKELIGKQVQVYCSYSIENDYYKEYLLYPYTTKFDYIIENNRMCTIKDIVYEDYEGSGIYYNIVVDYDGEDVEIGLKTY